ncbi:V-type proton ATPase subunit C [[Candida] anglica]|uniref:V-type proton ATPase subunit C n=1 Tax=[Candida] anglica TaxID=148631 RepID=A0ABP0EHE6_9ASCO
MDPIASYLIVSLPQSADSRGWLEQSLNGGKSPIIPFKLDEFQIGTLDSLVQESEELSKLDQQLGSSVSKIVDILSSVTETSPTRSVLGKPVLNYIESFSWNTSKYRLDKPIKQLISVIANEAITLDNDVRASYQGYQTAKSNYVAADRKKNGDLSIKSLHDIVKPEQFVLDSDHLTTVLIAVPKNLISDFQHSYETLTDFVIPRSATVVATDSEYTLYTVALFKKYQQEFITGAREHKWHPRTDFVYSEEVLNNLRKEFDLTRANESKTKNDLLRLAKTAYSDILAAWFHIKAIRIYVESILRYGLPPKFDCSLVKFDKTNKNLAKSKKELIEKFGYLGGEAFDKNNANLHEYASLVDTDYEPFVLYEVDIV